MQKTLLQKGAAFLLSLWHTDIHTKGFLMKKKFNWSTYITLIGAVVIFFIILTGMVDTIYILPVLGVMCLMYGISSLIQMKRGGERLNHILQRSLLQIILGAFILSLGLIESLHIQLSQTFWNGFAVIIVVVVVLWLFLKHKK